MSDDKIDVDRLLASVGLGPDPDAPDCPLCGRYKLRLSRELRERRCWACISDDEDDDDA